MQNCTTADLLGDAIKWQHHPPKHPISSTATYAELGLTGLSHAAGIVNEEFLNDLNTADRRYKTFNEMRNNSPVLAGALAAIELSVRRVDWRIEGDDARADFVREAFADMAHSWRDHLSEVLTFVPFGWSWFEIVYKRREGPKLDGSSSDYDDGRIGWRKLAFRAQDSLWAWDFDDRGNVQAMQQRTWPALNTVMIPLSKSVLYRTTREKNNPEGRSLLRAAYVPYYYAKNLQAIEAIGAERDLAGLPVVKLPTTADTSSAASADVRQAKELVRRIRQDEQAGVVLPDGWSFWLLSAAGSKQMNISAIIERYEKRMTMAFLAQFLMLGQDRVGSYGLSQDHSELFMASVDALADVISETFSQYAIPRLLRLNGMDTRDAPRLVHGPVMRLDIAEIAEFFGGLARDEVITPDDDLENWLRRVVRAPERTQESSTNNAASRVVSRNHPTTSSLEELRENDNSEEYGMGRYLTDERLLRREPSRWLPPRRPEQYGVTQSTHPQWTTIERLSVDDPHRWFRIMPVGTFERFGRQVQVTRDDIGDIVRNWLRGIPDSVLPVNRAHENAEGRVGHIASLDARADGLYARINWLPKGLDLLQAGAFRYVSPEVIWEETDFDGKRVKNVLMGLALENSPFFGEKVAIYSLEEPEDELQGQEEPMAIQERGLRDAVKGVLSDLGIKVGRDAERFGAR